MLFEGKQIKAASIVAGKYGAASIATADIANDAVDATKLKDDAVTDANRAVTTNHIRDAAITTAKINAGAVTTNEIGTAAVTPAKADLTQVWAFTAEPTYNADPVNANGLARKSYVDAVGVGLRDFKDSVRVATAAALPAVTAAGSGVGKTLTATAVGVLTVDGIATVLNDRILVKNQATAADNGIYKCTTEGTAGVAFVLTRATDADASAEVTAGMYTFVDQGTANADSAWVLSTNDAITLDTTGLTFTQFSGLGQITAGGGLTKTGNTLDLGAGNGITVNADNVEVIYGLVGVIADVGTAAAAGTANTAARSDHVHKAFFAVSTNKAIAAIATAADNDPATADGVGSVASTPAGDGYVQVFINGLLQEVGDGVKTKDCYFAADRLGATAARAIAAIAAGDYLHWVGSVAGFQLAATDKIDFCYEA